MSAARRSPSPRRRAAAGPVRRASSASAASRVIERTRDENEGAPRGAPSVVFAAAAGRVRRAVMTTAVTTTEFVRGRGGAGAVRAGEPERLLVGELGGAQLG